MACRGRALHQPPFRSGLVSDQCHAQNLFRQFKRFGCILGDFHPAAFAASSGVNLRFYHHHLRLQPLRRFSRFFLREHHLPARSRHAVSREYGFSLVFVNLHFRFCLLDGPRPGRAPNLCDDGLGTDVRIWGFAKH